MRTRSTYIPNIIKQMNPAIPNMFSEDPLSVNKTLKPVEEKDANLEAELGETVVTDMQDDGLPEQYKVAGKRHYAGGTPLNLPDDSFVFSRDKSMKIKDPAILKQFGKSGKDFTPADIAKKYDINEYKKVLADKNSDQLQRDTAEMMIANYNEKLGKLALVQESLKGFPEGIPAIAMPYVASAGFNPADIYSTQGEESDPNADNGQSKYGGNIVKEMFPAKMKLGGGKKVRIVSLPKAQQGMEVYPKEFLANYLKRYSGKDTSDAFPAYLKNKDTRKENMQVDKVQKPRGENIYGKFDFHSPEMMNDFKARNEWYFKKNPKFNPQNAEEVKDFQKAYNKRASEMGLGSYFKEDGKFGQLTHGAPDLDFAPSTGPEQPVYKSTPVVNTAENLPVNHLNAGNQDDPNAAPFWLQDIIGTMGAASDLFSLKKYLPWQADFSPYLPSATFYDPSRELAANAEGANISSQVAAMFAGPQGLSARLSDIQGQGAKNAADILGKYNNLNVGEANRNEAQRADILNNAGLTKANRKTQLYDETVAANQNFDNAKLAARNRLRESLVNAITNKSNTQVLNSMYPQFKVDPSTGGLVKFTQGKKLTGANTQKSLEDKFSELMSDPKLAQHPEVAYKMALHSLGIQDDNQASNFMHDYSNMLP